MRESFRTPGGGVLSGSTPNVPLYTQSISSGVGLSHVQGNEFHEIEMALIKLDITTESSHRGTV
jgi:hypothetical protein